MAAGCQLTCLFMPQFRPHEVYITSYAMKHEVHRKMNWSPQINEGEYHKFKLSHEQRPILLP